MKRIISIIICTFILLCGCNNDTPLNNESIKNESSAYSAEESSIVNTNESSEIPDYNEESDNRNDNFEEDVDESKYNDDSSETANFIDVYRRYPSWNAFYENRDDFSKYQSFYNFIENFDGSQFEECLGTVQINVWQAYYVTFETSDFDYYHGHCVYIYPLKEEELNYHPLHYSSLHNLAPEWILDYEHAKEHNFVNTTCAYRLTKEDIDIYLVPFSSDGTYELNFKLGNYIVKITSEFFKWKYMLDQDGYDKLLDDQESYKALYELGDFSTESSELIRTLKEIILE